MGLTSWLKCIADVQARLGEGPVWVENEQALYWVDIERGRYVEEGGTSRFEDLGRVFRWSEAEGTRVIDLDRPVCSLMPRAAGGFIGGGYDGFIAVDPLQGKVEVIGTPEPDLPQNRFNDGKTDREGRFWAGTMDKKERETTGSLYRLDPDLNWTQVDTGYRVTNGPAFSLDGRTMYHSDSALRTVYAFDLGKDGTASNRRVFAEFSEEEGYPDGMTVDVEDCLWIAFWGGWCVRRLSPAGEVIEWISVHVQQPTSCAFGGKDYDRLFITSARRGLLNEDLGWPNAGGVLVAAPGVRGVPETPFRG